MPVANQRQLPVIYVAGSARELPAEVQDWLGRAETCAVASPHLYDMLAQLARGKKFAAVIVNIQSVDWSEMEFFDHAMRLSRHTPIYVAGPVQQRAKLEAACRRGARLFDALSLEEHCRSIAESHPPRSCERAASEPHEAAAAAPSVEAEAASTQAVGDEWGESPVARSMPVQSCKPWSSPVRLAEPCDEAADESDGISVESDAEAASSSPPEAAETIVDEAAQALKETVQPASGNKSEEGSDGPTPAEELAGSAPPADAGQTPQDSEQDREAPVVFPWSVVPNRPKRTPPSAVVPADTDKPPSGGPANASGQAGASLTSQPARRSTGANWADPPFRSVRLTAEEIAALMGPTQRPSSPEAHT